MQNVVENWSHFLDNSNQKSGLSCLDISDEVVFLLVWGIWIIIVVQYFTRIGRSLEFSVWKSAEDSGFETREGICFKVE